jgi:uncharacterized protein YbjT (DUF2867 family)
VKLVVFGASGMIGSGVLLAALRDPGVTEVWAVVRRPLQLAALDGAGVDRRKLVEIVHTDLTDLAPIAGQLADVAACCFCVGISSAGVDEATYTRATADTALEAGRTIARVAPQATFCFVSGAGTDVSSRTMWARVKGQTEQRLQGLGLKAVACFRPGFIAPIDGVASQTGVYRAFYAVTRPITPLLVRHAPGVATTSTRLAQAMLRVARDGTPCGILESRDINALASDGGSR